MTRINIGISPDELCDQHLVAEYRELPRMRAFALDRLAKYGGPGPRPTAPTLGAGHMAYFLPFGDYLRHRWNLLRAEMVYRGMAPTLEWRPYPEELRGPGPSFEVVGVARRLLQARILERLSTMRQPTWTRRDVPAWTSLTPSTLPLTKDTP